MKPLPQEVCENCGHPIGKLETPQIWKQNVVCSACRAILEKQARETAPVPKTPLKAKIMLRLMIYGGSLFFVFILVAMAKASKPFAEFMRIVTPLIFVAGLCVVAVVVAVVASIRLYAKIATKAVLKTLKEQKK